MKITQVTKNVTSKQWNEFTPIHQLANNLIGTAAALLELPPHVRGKIHMSIQSGLFANRYASPAVPATNAARYVIGSAQDTTDSKKFLLKAGNSDIGVALAAVFAVVVAVAVRASRNQHPRM